jgi:hypothetical protein
VWRADRHRPAPVSGRSVCTTTERPSGPDGSPAFLRGRAAAWQNGTGVPRGVHDSRREMDGGGVISAMLDRTDDDGRCRREQRHTKRTIRRGAPRAAYASQRFGRFQMEHNMHTLRRVERKSRRE